jgi:hypothetical protein
VRVRSVKNNERTPMSGGAGHSALDTSRGRKTLSSAWRSRVGTGSVFFLFRVSAVHVWRIRYHLIPGYHAVLSTIRRHQ